MAQWPLGEVRVAPSILSSDFARLGAQVQEVLDAGARVIHVDVMDGHFVPAITVGPLVVSALREQAAAADALLDVHLMIERPERHVADFVRAGADSVTFHSEATAHGALIAGAVHELGASVGLAINPGTPVEAMTEMTADIDLALCMTVNPGWGGQKFIARSPDKVSRLRRIIGEHVALEVDGGVDSGTVLVCRQAGASVFVAGSAIFGAPDPGEAYRAIADAAEGVRDAGPARR